MMALTCRGPVLGLVVLGAVVGCTGNVTQPPAAGVTASVAVIPATAFLRPGAQLAVRVSAFDRDSVAIAGRSATWTSSATNVATVSSTGVVTATGLGSAIVTASVDGIRARMGVSVASAPTAVPSWDLSSRSQTDVTFLGIWMASALEGWAVGQRATILHTVDGGVTWTPQPVPATVTLTSIWGTGPNNVYAVGSAGVVVRYDGATWTRVPVPAASTFLSVWGFDANAIWIVGVDVAMHWDGSTWEETLLPGSAELWGIWGSSPANVQAVGQNGLIVRWDGNAWRQVPSPFPELLLGIWGSSASNAWAVGIQGAILHWDGQAWRHAPSPTRGSLFGLWGRSSSEVWAVGNNGVMLRWNGVAWSLVPQRASGENMRAVHGAGATGIGVAGWNGTILRRGPEGWVASISSPVLYDVVDDLIVGSAGVLLRRTNDGAALTREESPEQPRPLRRGPGRSGLRRGRGLGADPPADRGDLAPGSLGDDRHPPEHLGAAEWRSGDDRRRSGRNPAPSGVRVGFPRPPGPTPSSVGSSGCRTRSAMRSATRG